jgi:uroporphyrinogen decarboxylase
MVPLAAVGVDVRVEPGRGPVLGNPLRPGDGVAGLARFEPEQDVSHVLEAIRLLRKELNVPLIGFAGGPFTLASYLIEGGPSRTFHRTKAFMHGEPAAWDSLMQSLGRIVLTFLRSQVEAGVQAVQVFDSWVGALDPDDYARFVLPVMRNIFDGLADLAVPRIHFGVGTGELLPGMRQAGGDVMGIDWRVPLHDAWERVGFDVAVQGNLDPGVCLAPWEAVEAKALSVLRRAAGRDGHIFNLGHGVLPETPVENLQRLVDLVHQRTARDGAASPGAES